MPRGLNVSATRAKRTPSASLAEDLQELMNETAEPLAADLRRFMENGFGQDFSDVVVHRSALADKLCRALRTRGFAHGNRVCFANGAYQPDEINGRWVSARALASVVQQRLSAANPPAGSHGPLNRLLVEMEADQAADVIARGGHFTCTVADNSVLTEESATAPARSVRYTAPARQLAALLPRLG
jgi:hypothetical protein